tara:strand:- start:25 stop:195 length:171 start_codon:yes stop_codon:yes gene_type:complete
MNITSAQYVKNNGTVIFIKAVINGQENNVAIDEKNTDYAEILKQVKEGKLTIKDAD